jgi:hypothetical protein
MKMLLLVLQVGSQMNPQDNVYNRVPIASPTHKAWHLAKNSWGPLGTPLSLVQLGDLMVITNLKTLGGGCLKVIKLNEQKFLTRPLIILNLKENWNLIFQFIYSFNIILSWELTSVQNKSQVHTTWWIFCQKTRAGMEWNLYESQNHNKCSFFYCMWKWALSSRFECYTIVSPLDSSSKRWHSHILSSTHPHGFCQNTLNYQLPSI